MIVSLKDTKPPILVILQTPLNKGFRPIGYCHSLRKLDPGCSHHNSLRIDSGLAHSMSKWFPTEQHLVVDGSH